MKVVKLNDAEFREALLKLRNRGGQYQRAAEEAARMITHFDLDISEAHQVTNHGESRIKHCVKYDLPGACRLVTVHNEGVIYVLYVGDHESVDRWLDRHEGLTLSCERSTMRVKVVHVNRVVHEWKQPDATSYTTDNAPYFSRVPDFDISTLIPEPALQKQITRLHEGSSDDEVQEAFELLELKHADKAVMLFEMLFELKRGDTEAAGMRLKLFLDKAVELAKEPALEQKALDSPINSDQLVVLNELTEAGRARLLDSQFQEWMVYLHPDQKRVAEADFDRPVVLTGVSGSGKTCILIHRARHLAKKYPGQRIGILTLNRSLARLLRNLVDLLCVDGESAQIEVHAFYDYFRKLLHDLGSDRYLEQLSALVPAESPMQQVIRAVDRNNLANEVDIRSGETLEDTWNDFYATLNPDVCSWLKDVSRYLEEYRIDASRYLREEFTLLRSAFSVPDRTLHYESFDRAGRSVPLQRGLRADVLRILLFYEEYMLAGGVLDVLSLTQALLPLSKEVRSLPADRRFRCLLVDEFQDFSSLDLGILQLVPTSEENGLFLAGDTVQKILVKRLKLSEVGLDRGNARHIQLRKNYRNSRQILRAASRLANTYGTLAGRQGEEIEVLDPELAVRETTMPTALKTNHQLKKAWEVARDCMSDGKSQAWTICIATANPDQLPVSELLRFRPQGLRAEELSGDYIRKPEVMVVSTLNDMKGFEFNLVVVVGCNQDDFPAKGVPLDEAWRDALRLYVAMTRARDQVYLLFDRTPSPFLDVMREELRWDSSDIRCDHEPSSSDEPPKDLSRQAGKSLKATPAPTSVKTGSCSHWFCQESLEILRRYFLVKILRSKSRIDFRGVSGKTIQIAHESQERAFVDWLTPKNMEKLHAKDFYFLRDFITGRNFTRRSLKPLERDLHRAKLLYFFKRQ